jgi:hypothetical protein
MLGKALVGTLITAIAAGESPAATASMTYSSAPTVNLPGYTTYTFTTHVDVPIAQFDFYGDGSTDPATGLGFFGPLNQLNPFGQRSVFPSDLVFFVVTGDDRGHDSHFLAGGSCDCVIAPPGKEGPNHLQGSGTLWGPVRPFAQLVVPDARREPIQFRGKIIIYESANVATEFPVSGTIPPLPEPTTCVLALALCAGVRTRRRNPRAYEACGQA